jgi:hypothetical protein
MLIGEDYTLHSWFLVYFVYNQKYGFAIPDNFVSIQGEEIGRTTEDLMMVREEYKKRNN